MALSYKHILRNWKGTFDETDEEILAFAVAQLRATFNSLSTEIVLPFEIEYPDKEVTIIIPKSGDKKKLLIFLKPMWTTSVKRSGNVRCCNWKDVMIWSVKKVLYQLQQDLQLPLVPVHIECFDNSNFQGSYPVSAMVCFKDGMPSKKIIVISM